MSNSAGWLVVVFSLLSNVALNAPFATNTAGRRGVRHGVDEAHGARNHRSERFAACALGFAIQPGAYPPILGCRGCVVPAF
jgi:hypothetical protein